MASFRTGYENLPAAISDAFKTYWGRKEGQKGREHDLEMQRRRLDAALKEAKARRDFEAAERIEKQIHELDLQKKGAGYAEELKKIPSTIEHKSAIDAQGAMYGDIATGVDTKVGELLPILIGAENFDDFLDKSQGRAFFTDRLDKDQFQFLQQNSVAAEQYLKRNIAEYTIPRSQFDKAQQKELEKELRSLGYLERVDWTEYYAMLREQEEIGAEKKKIKEERLKKFETSEKKIYGGKEKGPGLMDIQGYFPLMP